MINMTLSYNPTNKMATTDFNRFARDYSFDDMGIVLKMDGRYSPFIFNNNYRKSENYIQNISNCIILDFDDGEDYTIIKLMGSLSLVYGTSRKKTCKAIAFKNVEMVRTVDEHVVTGGN